MTTPSVFVTDAARIRAELYERFTQAYPRQGEALLPEGAREMPQVLLDAAEFVLSKSKAAADAPVGAGVGLQGGVDKQLREWALDLRRVGFPPHEFEFMAQLLADVGGLEESERETLCAAAEAMREATEAADLAGIPAAHAAQVTEVVPAGGVQIVRLEAGMPIEYAPGQVLPVMQTDRRGVWRGLAPALPPNSFGQLEFHVDGELDVAPGAYVTIGAARGEHPRFEGPKALIVADGTGLAAAKALVFSLLERPQRPEVQLLIAARTPADLYDIPTFAALAKAHAWLDVTCVVEDDLDGDPVAEHDLPQLWVPLPLLVAGPGMWWGRDIVLCAADARTKELREALLNSGAPGASITVIAHDAPWRFH